MTKVMESEVLEIVVQKKKNKWPHNKRLEAAQLKSIPKKKKIWTEPKACQKLKKKTAHSIRLLLNQIRIQSRTKSRMELLSIFLIIETRR